MDYNYGAIFAVAREVQNVSKILEEILNVLTIAYVPKQTGELHEYIASEQSRWLHGE